ncbi:hypothetical protein B0H14DRAFT_3138177 [Mycena olivaceomarginata]|nr:hypothetical protein B0H14DRAFT_3138177 [Mycena olivaceomarginata]
MAGPLCRAEHIMECVVRPAIYLLKLTLRSDCGGWTPPDTITPARHMLVRDSISQIIQVLNFVHAKARVTDNVDLAFGPCLASLHELQMLLLTYCVNGDDTTLPPLLERCLSRSLVIAKSGQLIRPIADFTAFLPGHKGEIWMGRKKGCCMDPVQDTKGTRDFGSHERRQTRVTKRWALASSGNNNASVLRPASVPKPSLDSQIMDVCIEVWTMREAFHQNFRFVDGFDDEGARNVRATTAQALRVSLFEVDPYSGASISSTIASMSSWGKAAMVVRTWEVARVETAAIYFRLDATGAQATCEKLLFTAPFQSIFDFSQEQRRISCRSEDENTSQVTSALESLRLNWQHEYQSYPEVQNSLRTDTCIRQLEASAKYNEPKRTEKVAGSSSDIDTVDELRKFARWCLKTSQSPNAFIWGCVIARCS